MKAREFLAHGKLGKVTERHLLKEPLTAAELRALAKRVGGIRELVAPKRKAELAGLKDAELLAHLAENPGHLRRPIIDTGAKVTLGFTDQTRAALTET